MAINPSILKAPKRRKQVSLDLPEPSRLGAPTISAGRYQVAVPQIKKGNVDQLVEALGKFATVGVKALTESRIKADEEVTEVVKSFSPEEAKVLLSGDVDAINDQLGDTISKLDSAQRKGLLRFVDNPQNFVRANKTLGVQIAQEMAKDIESDPTQFVQADKPVAEQLEQLQADVIEKLGLRGTALLGYMETSNNVINTLGPRLEAERNRQAHEEQLLKDTNALTNFVVNEDYEGFVKHWSEQVGHETVDTQNGILNSMFNTLINNDNLVGARSFLTELKEQDIVIGKNAEVSEELLSRMASSLENASFQNDQRKRAEASRTADAFHIGIERAVLDLSQGKTPEAITFTASNGEIIELPAGLDGESAPAYLARVESTLLENEEKLSVYEKGIIYRVKGMLVEARDAPFEFATNAGIPAMVADLTESLQSTNVSGANVFGHSSEEIDALMAGHERQMQVQVQDIFNDPDMSPAEKLVKAQQAVANYGLQAKRELQASLTDEVRGRHRVNAFKEIGLGPSSNLAGNITSQYVVTADPDTGERIQQDPETRKYVLGEANELSESLMEEATEIWERPRTAKEADLTDAEFFDRKMREIQDVKNFRLLEFDVRIRSSLHKRLTEDPDFTFGELDSMRKIKKSKVDAYNQSQVTVDAPDWMGVPTATQEEIDRASFNEFQDKFGRWADNRRFDGIEGTVKGRLVQNIRAKRLYIEDSDVITLAELRSQKVDGIIPITPSSIDWQNEPVLGLSTIKALESDDNEEAERKLSAYMNAFGLEYEDPEARQLFVQAQALILQDDYGLSVAVDAEEQIKKNLEESINKPN